MLALDAEPAGWVKTPPVQWLNPKANATNWKTLYIADSSVLPNCPSFGPGLTVIAMALRLAENLSL